MKTSGVILAIALAACQPADTEPAAPVEAPPTAMAVDPASVRAEIESITADYTAADRIGDHATIAAFYADDAVLHPAGKPAVRGRAGIDAYFAANDAEPQDITLTTNDVVVSEAGDMAYEVGTTTTPDYTGKYLTVYRRTPDGWRIVGDSWSEDAPPLAGN